MDDTEELVNRLQTAGIDAPQRLLTTEVMRATLKRLAARGMNAKQAAKIAGCSQATANDIYKDPAFRTAVHGIVNAAFEDTDARIYEKQRTLGEMIEEQSYKSFNDLIGMLEEPDLHPSLRVKINQDFLDRTQESAAFAPKATKFSAPDLAQAANAAREMDKVIEMKRKKAS